MGIPFIRFLGPSSTLIALCIGGWYLLTHAPSAEIAGLPNSPLSANAPANEGIGFGLPGDLLSPDLLKGELLKGLGGKTNSNGVPNAPTIPVNNSRGASAPPVSTQVPAPTGFPSTAPNNAASSTLRVRSQDRIRIASFNIQDFGPKKAANNDVMRALAQIILCFDFVGIQEVSSTDPVVDQLTRLVNSQGATYQNIVSERIGRSTQKEQYAYVWDASKLALVPQSQYKVEDSSDLMSREPFVASFQVRLPPTVQAQPFRFTVINVHTAPGEVARELNVLDDVFRSVRAYEYPEDDVILMGDLNVDVNNLGELGRIPNVVSLTSAFATNTRGDKQYDHILIDQSLTTEFIPGRSGVFVFENELGITTQQALALSDHRPVWAEFKLFEQPRQSNGPVAAVPNAPGSR